MGVLLILILALSACKQINPNSWDMHGDLSAAEVRKSYEAERRRESARFSDRDLQRMVDQLFIEADPNRSNFHGLLYAGSRPVPFLIQALDEPRTQTTVFFREGFHLYGNSPFERICDLLDAVAPPEAVKPLARYLEHPDSTFRRQAAVVLGKIGTPESLGRSQRRSPSAAWVLRRRQYCVIEVPCPPR
jgi:HEAT repeat protein